MRTCAIEGCDRPVRGHGWCHMHYQRWRRHGDPLTVFDGRLPVLRPGDGDPRHGKRSSYVKGCACDECTAAERIYKANYRARKVEA
jgi:hypothetical protein